MAVLMMMITLRLKMEVLTVEQIPVMIEPSVYVCNLSKAGVSAIDFLFSLW